MCVKGFFRQMFSRHCFSSRISPGNAHCITSVSHPKLYMNLTGHDALVSTVMKPSWSSSLPVGNIGRQHTCADQHVLS